MVTDTFEQPAFVRGLFVLAPPLALMIAALIFGGASRLNPIGFMVVELFGLLALMPALLRSPDFSYSRLTLAALAILVLTAALPILQLTPLPPAVWSTLPGRAPMAQAVAVVGLPPHWRSMSLTPDLTAAAVLFLLAPAGMFVAALQCSPRERLWLVVAVIAIAIVSVLVGVVQAASGHSENVQFYPAATVGLPNGFFANRNHQASFMVAAIGLCAALLGPERLPVELNRRPFVIMAAMLLFAIASAATLSRTGVILSGAMLIAALAAMQGRMHGVNRWLRFAVPAAVILALCALVLVFKGGAVLERFQEGGGATSRTDILPGVIAAGRTLQPIGGGVGSFDLVYRAVEPLNKVIPEYLNHAHNDYVELWLEAGWPAAALMAAMIAWWGYAAFLAWFGPKRSDATLARSGSIVTAALLAHAAVDYPLRTPALAVVFALGCAMMLPAPIRRRG